MQERARTVFLDKLRVAATCAVVLLHTVTGIMDATDISQYPLEKCVFLTVLDLVCWCVPVFLLISGYLFLNPERKFSFRDMLFKYCRRVVAALFLFGVPFAWIELLIREKTFRGDMLWQGVAMVLRGESWSHLWYLYLILFLYLVTPLLRCLLKRMPLWSVYAVLGGLLLGGSILPFVKKLFSLEQMQVLPDGSIYLFYYVCGYLFACGRTAGKRKISTDGKKVCVNCPDMPEKSGGNREWTGRYAGKLCGIGTFLLAIGMVVSRIFGNYTLQMAYNYPFTVLAALLLFAYGNLEHNKTRPQGKKMDWQKAGSLCFAVYLIHPVFVNIYYKFLHVSPLSFCIWGSLPLFFFGNLIPAVLGAWFLRKIPPLKKWVL